MPKKKDDLSWEDIGKAVGKKIEDYKMDDCKGWKKNFVFKYQDHGGGFGRLLFAIGILYVLNLKGLLVGIPSWTLVLLVIGFALMRL